MPWSDSKRYCSDLVSIPNLGGCDAPGHEHYTSANTPAALQIGSREGAPLTLIAGRSVGILRSIASSSSYVNLEEYRNSPAITSEHAALESGEGARSRLLRVAGRSMVSKAAPVRTIGGRGIGCAQPRGTPDGAKSNEQIIEELKSGELADTLGSILILPEEGIVSRQGTEGTEFPASCNFIKLLFQPGFGVYQYEVRFEPDIDNVVMRKRLVRQMAPHIGMTRLYDGNGVLYLPIKLEGAIERNVVVRNKRGETLFKTRVKVTFVRQNTYGKECLHLYNVLLKRIMGYLDLVRIGDRHFDSSRVKTIDYYKLEVWPGFVTTVKDMEGGILLVCDSTARVLRTETVLQSIYDILNSPRDVANRVNVCKNELAGCTVLTRYNNKLYRIDDVDFDINPQFKFERDGRVMTLIEYYREQYDVEIRDVNQPLLLSRAKSSHKDYSREMIVLLVPELCYRTGLTNAMQNDFMMMKDVNAHTILSPATRQARLQQYLDNVASNEQAQKVLSDWGLTMPRETVEFAARYLNPETIIGRGKTQQCNEKVDWTSFMMREVMFDCAEMRNWIVMYVKRNERSAVLFARLVTTVAPQMGMTVGPPKMVQLENERTDTYLQTMRYEICREMTSRGKDRQLQMVVAVLPYKREDIYSAIKRLAYVELGVPCQCVLLKTLLREDKLKGIAQKIMIQMNAKLGGVPWHVNLAVKGTMICGIDTFHDTTRFSKSVVALVATANANFDEGTHWYSVIGLQNCGQEISDKLQSLFTKCLQNYYLVNNQYPKRIIIYRDGVADSQIRIVRDVEVKDVARSCANHGIQPQIAMIVIKKRIVTKIYAKEGPGACVNPPAGTIVDHTITNRYFYDFYLISQRTTQGTATPNHYVVVEDSTTLLPDQMQRLTYKLCHLYFNWSGTIKCPAPCQYAHKLAYITGQSLKREPSERLASSLFYL